MQPGRGGEMIWIRIKRTALVASVGAVTMAAALTLLAIKRANQADLDD